MTKKTKKPYSLRRKKEISRMILQIVQATEWSQYELGAACCSSQFIVSRLRTHHQKRTDRTDARVPRLTFYYGLVKAGKLGKRSTFLSARKRLPERLRFTVGDALKEIPDTWGKALKDLKFRKEERRKKRKRRSARTAPRPTLVANNETPPLPPDKWELFKSLVHELLGVKT
jgi:hypothetical protein